MNEIVKQEFIELMDHAAEIAEAQKAPSTRIAYESDWKQFAKWASSVGIEIEPATESSVVAYIVYLSKLGLKPSSINRKITSISQIHLDNGHKRPVGQLVRNAYKGICRLKGTTRRRARPVTWAILSRMMSHIPDNSIGIRDRALLLVGFAGAFRRSELVAIDGEHLEFVDEGLVISQTHSKTNQSGELRKVAIPFVDIEGRCPVKAMRALIDDLEVCSGPVFLSLGSSGRSRGSWRGYRRLNASYVSKLVKNYAEMCGYPPWEFSGHSLRAGFATSAAAAGSSSTSIMARTGHKSFAVFANYVRDGRLFRGHPLTSIVGASSDSLDTNSPDSE